MSVVAGLLGVSANPVEFRYLQIDAGDGGHLFGLAAALPESVFVGVEGSDALRAQAAKIASRCELANLSFESEDYLQSHGERFDFVVWADGFSTRSRVRQKELLATGERLLKQTGLMLVGYDVLPGARCSEVARELVRRTAGGTTVGDLRAALGLLTDAPAGGRGVELLGPDLAALAAHDDAQLERVLAGPRAAMLFEDFARQVDDVGLKYLGDASYGEGVRGRALLAAQAFLADRTHPVEREQYVDILSGRRARRSLVVKAQCPLASRPVNEALHDLHFVSPLRRVASSDGKPVFAAPGGATMQVSNARLAAILDALGQEFPAAMTLPQLSAYVMTVLGRRPTEAELSTALLAAYERELVDVLSSPPRCASVVGKRPRVSRLSLIELELGRPLTNRLHFSVNLRSTLARALIPLLDGTRSVNELVREVSVGVAGDEATQLPGLVTAELCQLARQGLLEAS